MVLVTAFACSREEVCDWADNDRDGWIDEGFDADGDGAWRCGLTPDLFDSGDFDCDDNDGSINPSEEDVCDGVDNDCDGVVDPDCASVRLEYEGDLIDLIPADFDGDGALDLLIGSVSEEAQSVVLSRALGDGRGNFTVDSAQVLPEEWWILDVHAVWNEATGAVDLLSLFVDGLVQLSADERGDYGLSDYWLLWGDNGISGLMEIADLNSDGVDEVVVGGAPAFGEGAPGVWVLARDLGGDYAIHQTLSTEGRSQIQNLALADLNGDQRLDLVYTRGARLSWHLGLEGALFGHAHHQDYEVNIGQLKSGDFDSDGEDELIFTLPDRWRLVVFSLEGDTPSDADIEGVVRHPYGLEVGAFGVGASASIAVSGRDEPVVAILRWSEVTGFTEVCRYGTGPDPARLKALGLTAEVSRSSLLVADLTEGSILLVADVCGAEGRAVAPDPWLSDLRPQ